MTDLVFVDTNVFVYCIEEKYPTKQRAARAWRNGLWERHRGRISFQVLQEFYYQSVRKWPQHREGIRREIVDLLTWAPIAVDEHLLQRAWDIEDRYRIAFWDALIVAAAQAASCRYLLTEDLQAEQDFDGVTVVNPFSRDFTFLDE
jgi:predicted nucleic acid-binding protein